MKIFSLVENTSTKGYPVEHGLSLYIQREHGETILFDMGQSDLFAQNAERQGLDINEIDIAVVSHGHYDHGGGISTFLTLNDHAPIYLHREAFQPHYSLHEDGFHYIGLDSDLQTSSRLIFCKDTTFIHDDTTLFAGIQGNSHLPTGNRRLFGPTKETLDNFAHEQNLLIQENEKLILFAGCAHRGIINILRHAQALAGRMPTHVFAGMHLMKNGLSTQEEASFIRSFTQELLSFKDTQFYTMHCTGVEQYEVLHTFLQERICYFACGDVIEI